jgi:oligopeptide/dipeptide ABC transporter ATP-binding protein
MMNKRGLDRKHTRGASGGEPLLEINGLKTYFFAEDGVVKAVDGVDLVINRGEVLGLVGESGCGKSVTSLSIMRLVDYPGKVVGGTITFDGIDLREIPESAMVRMRGERISMIFQQPQASLDPMYKVGKQISDALQANSKIGSQASWDRSVELLKSVGIPDPERRAHAYPHELSGGMAQRVMIAMAMAREPDLIIADEPTTALDVTIQAQVLDVLRRIQGEHGSSIIFISHNLGVIATLCHRVMVMYGGLAAEVGSSMEVFSKPTHQYTNALLKSIPRLDDDRATRLHTIEGQPPSLNAPPSSCPFHPRCSAADDKCRSVVPPSESLGGTHSVACFHKAGH